MEITIKEILQDLTVAHNLAAQVTVSGNNAILMGDALRMMRRLVAELNGMLGVDTDLKDAATDIMEETKKATMDHMMQTYGGQNQKKDEVA